MKRWLVFWISGLLAWIGLGFLHLGHRVDDGATVPFFTVYAALRVPGQALSLLPLILGHVAASAIIAGLVVLLVRWIERRSQS